MPRPHGTTEYGEPKNHRTHFMTPLAHKWILDHKALIENAARDHTKESAETYLKDRFSQADIQAVREGLDFLADVDFCKAVVLYFVDRQQEESDRESRIKDIQYTLENLLTDIRDATIKDAVQSCIDSLDEVL